MLRKIRIVLAVIFLIAITALFCDYTGTAARLWGWMAKIQFLPAVLSLNFAVIIGLILLTLLFGRVYCSVICPLGVTQDLFNWLRGKTGPKKGRKNRFHFTRPLQWLRVAVLAIFVVLFVTGFASLAMFIAPYSAFGRIASSLIAPVYDRMCAGMVNAMGPEDFTFYTVDSFAPTTAAIIVASVSLAVVAVAAWFGGRIYCNSVCPVGTVLGFLSRFSLFRPVIDKSACISCGKCARRCKASCIDPVNHRIDLTRCVACMDCLDNCSTHAISYTARRPHEPKKTGNPDSGRRSALAVGAVALTAALSHAQSKTTDGGLAPIIPKERPKRKSKIVPPGALSVANLESHCTSCQLCISQCPNQVLRPSMEMATFMQPEVSYEAGYCRPECTACSDVCPTGAIRPVGNDEKSSIQIGRAVVDRDLCFAANGSRSCGACSRHCPAGAIMMVPVSEGSDRLMPVVNESLCIGCGACENLCPSRPISAIRVEGLPVHRYI